MTDETDRQTVTILGERLPVKVTSEDSNTRKAITRLREQIKSIRDQAPEATRLQIALLSALNLAGNVIQAENEPKTTGLSDETLDRFSQLEEQMRSMMDDEAR